MTASDRRNSFGPVRCAFLLGAFLLAGAIPALAAEEATSPIDSPAGTIFKWINFLLVAAGLAYVVAKFGRPYFSSHAQSISQGIREAAAEHGAAERAFSEASQLLGQVSVEVEEMRLAAQRESAAETVRIRGLAHSDADKILKTALAEIAAAERAGRQELRAIAARLATERAAALLHERMNAPAQAILFRSFVSELQRAAQ